MPISAFSCVGSSSGGLLGHATVGHMSEKESPCKLDDSATSLPEEDGAKGGSTAGHGAAKAEHTHGAHCCNHHHHLEHNAGPGGGLALC